jgi:hypothetical protein
MLKNRSIFSLLAHIFGTVLSISIAVRVISNGSAIQGVAEESASDVGPLLSLLLFFLAGIVFIFAAIPFIAIGLGWTAFALKHPNATFFAAACYGVLIWTYFEAGEGIFYVPAFILAILGGIQERKLKAVSRVPQQQQP